MLPLEQVDDRRILLMVQNCDLAHSIKSRVVQNCDVARERVNGIDPILSLLSKVESKQGSIDRALLLRHWNKLFV